MQLYPADTEWLQEVYALVRTERPDEAGDLIYDRMDRLLGNHHMTRANAILGSLDLDHLDSFTMVGFLTITGAAREFLPQRALLAAQIRLRLLKDFPDRVERILVGLE